MANGTMLLVSPVFGKLDELALDPVFEPAFDVFEVLLLGVVGFAFVFVFVFVFVFAFVLLFVFAPFPGAPFTIA